MVDFGEAIKRPFSDWKKLAIGAVMYMIPIVNIITQFFGMGYVLTCGATAIKKQKKLPEWKDWGGLFIKGLLAAIIGIIYLIPAIIIGVIAVGATVLTGFTAEAMPAMLGSLGAGMVVTLLVGLLTVYIVPVAILMYASEGKFGSAFRLGDVFKKAFTGKYFAAWILAVVSSVVLHVVGLLISAPLAITIVLPLVISGFVSIIVGIISMTLIGEALGEIK